MSVEKLKHAPLKEVIFEVYWSGVNQHEGIAEDIGFDNAVGRFWERIKPIAPIQKRLIPAASDVKVFGIPIYQYWKGELTWPVIQHGPGILTINETESNYQWEKSYQPLILETLEKVQNSYDNELNFNRVTLRYIDAFELNESDIYTFVNENLQTSIDYRFPFPGKKGDFNLIQKFNLESDTTLQLQINSGFNNQTNQPAVVMVTFIEKSGEMNQEIMKWLDFAHDQTSNMFKQILKPEFYALLDK